MVVKCPKWLCCKLCICAGDFHLFACLHIQCIRNKINRTSLFYPYPKISDFIILFETQLFIRYRCNYLIRLSTRRQGG